MQYFFSFYMSFLLMFLYALACAIATFIENDYGVSAAKALIYNNAWFDILHLLLGLNLLGIIFYAKLIQRKKYSSLILHCALLVILLGAAITRYFGLEGGMHIREGENSNTIVTREEFIKLIDYEQNISYEFPISFSTLTQRHFQEKIPLNNEEIILSSKKYTPQKDSITPAVLEINLHYKNTDKLIFLSPNFSNKNMEKYTINNKTIGIQWGPKEIKLPFALHLDDFILERYLGSMSPSSYLSKIKIIDYDKNANFSYEIFMNNVLDYGGYRFFQSSYDQDEQGTILSVNKDPGKIPTYIGYALLIIGFLWILFDKNSRFTKLSNFLKKRQSIAIIILCLISFKNPSFAQDNKEQILDLIAHVQKNSYQHSLDFGTLLVQDFNGRIKPLDTLAMEFIHKITQKDDFLNLNYNQIFLAMMIYPKEFRQIKMIPTKTKQLRELIGVNPNEKYLAFDDVFNEGIYKLTNLVEEANRKKPNLRTQFDKDVLALDERINHAYYIYSGRALTIFPDVTEQSLKWFSPTQILPFAKEDTERIQTLLVNYFLEVHKAIKTNNWQNANENLQTIKDFQLHYGSQVIPKKERIELEILLNHYNIFDNLTYIYISFGFVFMVISFYFVIKNIQTTKLVYKIFYFTLVVCTIVHALALVIRWYVGEHAPWSNAYESMIYIAFSCIISAVVFFKNSPFALCAASMLSGISLFVAHLGFMDPQIGNLIPVLKSYWLNIHVSIITASYGFLALCFMVGLFTLLLFILRKNNEVIDQNIIKLHCINEISMIIGLAMLTIGNFLGGVWANESWGRYWGWDPKETWALISIVIYAMVLHLRFIFKAYYIYVFASASVLAFYSILMTYFGVNFYLSGLHSYANGDFIPIPTFVYILVLINLILIISAGFKRDLKTPSF
ncbi:cytochrome c biogenesis protein [Campylobacter peloridis]|uniref:cytochrome c biogenesis protein n=1 Tax=Campylobacter peloridis TaxID=488546 RepID=UPI001C73AF53|nr:cytochrome c biogenesis protein CcsA [Campylobacter peloridis]MBX1886150.1 cytochrome c biogenesis protein CcsA [Campylobacter peloridis]MBX2079319.1 cytochrome c biogenesis protein CcsA [Campylobacter peloridis]